MLKQLDAWHKTKHGYLAFGVLELLLAYIVGSFAINNGSLLFYAGTIVLLWGSVSNFVKFAKAHKHPKHASHRPKKTA